MLGTGAGAVLLFAYLTAPFLVVFVTLLYLAVRRGRATPRDLEGSKRLVLAAEVVWLIAIGVMWTVTNVVSIAWIPWLQPYASSPPQSEPSQVVRVEAFMWGYTLETYELKHGVVKFVARSIDTIHSMTIYSPRGEIVATVMLMPGMTEEIVVELKERGEYVIRCLEFCGDGHPAMVSKFRVV